MKNGRKTILIIEDDSDIRTIIAFNLKKESFNSIEANNGEIGLEKARQIVPDLILIDIMLPGIQGLDVCRIIKSDNNTKNIPIILISALGQEENIVNGLEAGADDYITKPFSNKIFLARIKSVLRRRVDRIDGDNKNNLHINGLSLNLGHREVRVDGKIVENLTFTEFQILFLLCSNPGWVFTRYQIIEKIRGDNYPVTDRSVDFQIVGLRKKLGTAGKLIKTIRSVGYRFTPDEQI